MDMSVRISAAKLIMLSFSSHLIQWLSSVYVCALKHSFTNSHYRNYLALKKEKNCNAFKVQAIMVILSEAVFIKIAYIATEPKITSG